MRPLHAVRAAPLLGALLVLGACGDRANPVAPERPEPDAAATLLALTCTASLASETLSCAPQGTGSLTPSPGSGPRAVIIGGQGQYVTLASANFQTWGDSVGFDVTVQNLIQQPLGTTNGETIHPDGVRVFFSSAPASAGTGTVTVTNPDGTGTFTSAGQNYFQYNTALAQYDVSSAKQWRFQVTPDVESFQFSVYVSAQVIYPDGYVVDNPYVLTLNPGEIRELRGTVRSVVGRVVPDATIDWATDAPATAAVAGGQVTAGASRGFATITPTSGPRPADYTTAVSVCQATVVSSGTNLPSSILNTDCFSSFGSNDFRPSTSYYGDLYRVTLTAGQTLTVSLDTGDDLDTYLVLADPNGIPVAANDDDESGVLGVGSRLSYTATESGVYVFEASTFNGLDQGGYTLRVTIS